MKPDLEGYFEEIKEKAKKVYAIAQKAREKGYDPERKVDIPIAKNMAERVIRLVSAVAPQLSEQEVINKIITRIKELEKEYGILDWRVSLKIAEEIAKEKFCRFESKLEAAEAGIRTGFAYHTLGTVASPLEGFTGIKVRKRADGKEYWALFFSGPIRSAGGTGASVCVLIADYVRKKLNVQPYDPTEEEIQRMVTEVHDFHNRITNLQYLPSEEEISFLTRHLPVQIDGDPSEKIEVSQYKDLKRIETNKLRNGVCLVIAECLCQKAPKLWKQLSKWGNDFDLSHWSFLEEFVEIQKKAKAKLKGEEKDEGKEKAKITPDFTFMKDIVAGRPILTMPMRFGGFRLRYGRARNSGYSSAAIHPATMSVLKNYIAIGTQLKLERPGKGAVVAACDTIEGPVVRLKDGTVLQLEKIPDKTLKNEIDKILFLGDILITYGDFLNRSHPLVPVGYCQEWWVQELEKAIVEQFGSLDLFKTSELTGITESRLKEILSNPFYKQPTVDEAITISLRLSIPLHPKYTYFWKAITKKEFVEFSQAIKRAKTSEEKIIVQFSENVKEIAEKLCIPHKAPTKQYIVFEGAEARTLMTLFESIPDSLDQNQLPEDVIEIINSFSKIKIRDKAGTFIGARMGRPEKAKMRKLTGSPHVLFPIGDEGGKLRSFQSAIEKGKVTAEFAIYKCESCNRITVLPKCEICDKPTKRLYYCQKCGLIPFEQCKHGKASPYTLKQIDIKTLITNITKRIDTPLPALVKGVRGTSNKDHIPEHPAKGILRAHHNITVNKDGTVRYDMTQMGITHFTPREIRTPVEKLRELGYLYDVDGKPLERDDQLLEIFPQDVILPACDASPDEGADKVFFRVSKFIDDLLVKLYGLEPFYNLNSPSDLVGHLVLGLAPHTSAAIVGRIIGFSKTQGYLAHPLFHAAHRRDLDGDESCLILLLDALLNFSRQYLPAHRGGIQDAPLVITVTLIPSEVDDMVFDMDCCQRYPLELYYAAQEYKMPWEVKVETVKDRLGKETQYYGYGFTHPVTDINNGVRCSAYKTIPSMEEKLKGQMEIAELISAVDEHTVAELVIEKHFIRDIKGNLRKFSMQQFRCVQCNEKFRRPPLKGICPVCNGRIIFTIAEGSIVKYLEPSLSLAKKYNLSPYLKQSLELLKRRVEDVFGKPKETQLGLRRWFG